MSGSPYVSRPPTMANAGQFGAFSMPSMDAAANALIGIDPNKPNPLVVNAATQSGDFSSLMSYGMPAVQAPNVGGGTGIVDWLFGNGTKESPGNIGGLLGGAQAIFNGWLGMQQYGLAKQKLEESKRQFDLNYTAQKNLTNSQLADRQASRAAFSPGSYQSVGDYMNQYGIK